MQVLLRQFFECGHKLGATEFAVWRQQGAELRQITLIGRQRVGGLATLAEAVQIGGDVFGKLLRGHGNPMPV